MAWEGTGLKNFSSHRLTRSSNCVLWLFGLAIRHLNNCAPRYVALSLTSQQLFLAQLIVLLRIWSQAYSLRYSQSLVYKSNINNSAKNCLTPRANPLRNASKASPKLNCWTAENAKAPLLSRGPISLVLSRTASHMKISQGLTSAYDQKF